MVITGPGAYSEFICLCNCFILLIKFHSFRKLVSHRERRRGPKNGAKSSKQDDILIKESPKKAG